MNRRLLVEGVCWAGIATAFLLAAQAYPSLPDQIPVHFDLGGHVDRYGGKSSVWFGPSLALIAYALASLLELVPDRYRNFPVTITEENAQRQYALARQMVGSMKVIVVLTFVWVEALVIQSALGAAAGPPQYFLPTVLCAIFAILSAYWYFARKAA